MGRAVQRREKAGVLIEAAIVVPLLGLLLTVLWSLGYVLFVYTSLNQMVRDATLSVVLAPGMMTSCTADCASDPVGCCIHENLAVTDAEYEACIANPSSLPEAEQRRCGHTIVQRRLQRLLGTEGGRHIQNGTIRTSLANGAAHSTFMTVLTATLSAPLCIYNGKVVKAVAVVDYPRS